VSDFGALRDRQRLAMGDEAEEAMDGGEPTVACADAHLPVLLQVIEEGQNLCGLQVGQRQFRDRAPLTFRGKSQEQLPGVPIRAYGVAR
jgi:hypothetical protein